MFQNDSQCRGFSSSLKSGKNLPNQQNLQDGPAETGSCVFIWLASDYQGQEMAFILISSFNQMILLSIILIRQGIL